MTIATVNPATGETLEVFAPFSDDQLEVAIDRSSTAFATYRHTPFGDRAEWTSAAADILAQDRDRVATMMTTEMGKTSAAAKAEVDKCARALRFYAEHAEELLADDPADADAVGARRAFARYQPLGPVLAVMPWNFPLWQVVRFAAPALMAGNTVLLKHASIVPRTALFIEDLVHRPAFPTGCSRRCSSSRSASNGCCATSGSGQRR